MLKLLDGVKKKTLEAMVFALEPNSLLNKSFRPLSMWKVNISEILN